MKERELKTSCSKHTCTMQKPIPSFKASSAFSWRVGYFFLRNFASSAAFWSLVKIVFPSSHGYSATASKSICTAGTRSTERNKKRCNLPLINSVIKTMFKNYFAYKYFAYKLILHTKIFFLRSSTREYLQFMGTGPGVGVNGH